MRWMCSSHISQKMCATLEKGVCLSTAAVNKWKKSGNNCNFLSFTIPKNDLNFKTSYVIYFFVFFYIALACVDVSTRDGVSQIHELIASKIGSYWQNFARNLGVIEGEIDRLGKIYKKDTYNITIELLRQFQSGNIFLNVSDYLKQLKQGLNNAKRGDIREDVEELIVRLHGNLHLWEVFERGATELTWFCWALQTIFFVSVCLYF